MIAAILTAAIPLLSNAVPAKPGIHTITQPDGTTLNVRITGDERAHQYLTEDGFPLVSHNGTFNYAMLDAAGNITASHQKASDINRRSTAEKQLLSGFDRAALIQAAETKARKMRARTMTMRSKGLFSEAGFPTKGKQKALVILVEYRDVKFTLADPHDYFSRMLNESGFADYGATGSARDYFRHCSSGLFDPEFTLLGPVTLANNMSYYGGNKTDGNDRNPQKMVIEACRQLDNVVDFSEYDRDGDGFIDNIFIFYAGRGEASGGGENSVWPHTWYVTAAESAPYVFDGVTLDRYACSNEWENGSPDGVGTFCHEFSHVLGLPDLYATSYSAAFTPGDWDVMDHGSYNNNGRTPPAYSSFERYALGWIEPRQLNSPANVTLRDISTNMACIINTPDDDEFYLFENRVQSGWDTHIPGHGMLVWHIHYDPEAWRLNIANNNPQHQHIDLIEADNDPSDETREQDAFPGPAGITSFGDDTTPAMSTWCGKTLNLPITDISEQGNTITFKVAGGVPKLPTVNMLPPTDITPGGFTARWEASEGADGYEIELYSTYISENGRPVSSYVDGFHPMQAGNVTSFVVCGLTPSTTYRLSVTPVSANSSGDPSAEISVTTLDATFDYLAPQALEATAVSATSFTASWLPLDEATGYLLDVYQYAYGDPIVDLADFTGGLSAFNSAGWSTDSRMTLSNEAYAGGGIPSLRLSAGGSYIDTPVYNDGLRALSFWHRGISASAENSILIKAMVEGAWTDVMSVPVVNGPGGKTTFIENIPDGASAARLVYSMPGKGSIAVDDIRAMHGGATTEVSVTPYSGMSVGNTCSAIVEQLLPATTYYYRVTAVNADNIRSARSGEIKVNTLASGNLDSPFTSALSSWRIYGNVLTLPPCGNFRITDAAGRTVVSGTALQPTAISIPAKGIYIVTSDTIPPFKIAVR